MKTHIKIYFKHFGYDESSVIKCECCPARAVDIHHIEARGMGGDPKGKKDVIENLQALCRECHVKYGDKKQFKNFLKLAHAKALNK